MSEGVSVNGVEELQQLAAALKTADAALRNGVRKGLRDLAKPTGIEVIQEGARKMPRRGGFAAEVARAKPGFRFSGSANPTVQLLLKDAEGHDLKSLDAGILRHPVFGQRKTWRSQRVPAGAFTKAFEEKSPKVRAAMLHAVQQALDDIASKA